MALLSNLSVGPIICIYLYVLEPLVLLLQSTEVSSAGYDILLKFFILITWQDFKQGWNLRQLLIALSSVDISQPK